MSSMRASSLLLVLFMALSSAPARCQDGSEWDRARQQLIASQRGSISQAIDRWRVLSANGLMRFDDYAQFLQTYPGFPDEEKIRGYAEKALDRDSPDLNRLVAYFDRFPPLTNPARARYALALAALQRPEARGVGLAAWRGGPMSDAAEAALFQQLAARLTADDHDTRMDALLWAGAPEAAARQMTYVSPAARPGFMARLALLQGSSPASLGLPVPGDALRDPGYIYASVRQARRAGNAPAAVQLLATRPPARTPPLDAEKWIAELLSAARSADAASAVRIAASIDDTFPPGTDVSTKSYRIRDDYTSLMWLGGTKALSSLGNATSAAPLFYRYGAAAQTPQTRAKGFYWAGRAASRAGDAAGANRYFEMAAAHPTAFYGMLALERLGRPIPSLAGAAARKPNAAERAAFMARPITAAVREVARDADWRTTVRFFREISNQAESEADHQLVAELANSLGRRDLGVILGQAAHSEGMSNFQQVAYPLIPAPPGSDWTMVHAISRQESQFSMNAVSHAGARGLMQLMPGTAREQAGKIGLSYSASALMTDASYNMRLGDSYFARMMDFFGGSYPLAVAAYNAGPGNVLKFLRSNGDPRRGSIDWIDWIEKIPLTETRNYVQRVLENAVIYEAMNPTRARYTGPAPLSHFLGKHSPG
ncbi:MAG: lytic transglycosylase domain-containing protein [Novosphingobium sp.]